MINGCCTDKACKPDTCMSLPEGRTCADCVHAERCVALFGAEPGNTWCDFFPRRFRAAAPREATDAAKA